MSKSKISRTSLVNRSTASPLAPSSLVSSSPTCSPAPLATFRIGFGLMMALSIFRFWWNGWIEKLYLEPTYFFSYRYFEWVKPLGNATYLLFALAFLSAVMVMLGWKYKLAIVVFFLSFTYIELMDKTTYLNHYYFVSLLSFVMIWLPAANYFSVDKGADKNATIPRWTINCLKVFVGVVYFYAGLAKLNSDWLINAQPLAIWLPAKYDIPLLGGLLQQAWVHYAFSWSGAAYDLFIVFFLLWRPTRPLAFVAVVIFHVLTRILFPIGMFPYIMIVSALVFFGPGFHNRLLATVAHTWRKITSTVAVTTASSAYPAIPASPPTSTSPITPASPPTSTSPITPASPPISTSPITPASPPTSTSPITPASPPISTSPITPASPTTSTSPITPATSTSPITPASPPISTSPITPATSTSPITSPLSTGEGPGVRATDNQVARPQGAKSVNWSKAVVYFVLILHLILPWRYLTYPGELFWTEEGYRFSWRVMLMEKAGYLNYKIVDPVSGQRSVVSPSDYLTTFQSKQLATQPDFILEFAHHLASLHQKKGGPLPAVYAESYVALNGRGSQVYVNPDINLIDITQDTPRTEWLMPFEDKIYGL